MENFKLELTENRDQIINNIEKLIKGSDVALKVAMLTYANEYCKVRVLNPVLNSTNSALSAVKKLVNAKKNSNRFLFMSEASRRQLSSSMR